MTMAVGVQHLRKHGGAPMQGNRTPPVKGIDPGDDCKQTAMSGQ
jgi:hypothetical protein